MTESTTFPQLLPAGYLPPYASTECTNDETHSSEFKSEQECIPVAWVPSAAVAVGG